MNNTSISTQRITSIDALRAFALFGIIIVHSVGRFCLPHSLFDPCSIDSALSFIVVTLFENRFASIFSILFGVSFYIILRKPDYPTSRFVWRCFLLMCIGLLNKFFYRSDALLMYGVCGMLLASLRGLSNKQLVYVFCILLVGGYAMSESSLSDWAIPYIHDVKSRYLPGQHDWMGVLIYWPQAIMWNIKNALQGKILLTLAKFTLGYIIGRTGIIEKMDQTVDGKILTYFLLFYTTALASFFIVQKYVAFSFIEYFLKQAMYFSGALFYAVLFIFFYNRATITKKYLVYLENYGKLGLTNYSFQGIIMVALLADFGLASYIDHVYEIVLIAWCLFFIQVIFSTLWLKYFTNGPLEYLWRCATNLKWMPFKKNNKV